jgi:EamA-like transporter family
VGAVAAVRAAGLVLFVLFPLSFNVGLRYTEASRGAVMLATMPIWSALLGRGVGERLTRLRVVGLALSADGVVRPHLIYGPKAGVRPGGVMDRWSMPPAARSGSAW